jgi:hypothetical protein
MTPLAALFIAILLCLSAPCVLSAQTLDVNGQLSGWFIVNDQEPSTPVFGVRYLPSLMVQRTFGEDRILDGELTVNAFASAEAADWDRLSGSSRLKPYRAWARVKTARFEARIGLQKINFGSATLLRPLMWFDSVDPRDPLQITEGVYGVLPRFYLPNEITVWAWGLYGSDRPKGWEAYATRQGTPELGGRVQVPLFKGSLAFTTHHRRADLTTAILSNDFPGDPGDPVAPEGRYALDGKWDVGIGLWFEGVWSQHRHPALTSPEQTALNVGADYTFGLGNGLYVLAEYFRVDQSQGLWGSAPAASLGAAMVRYPLGLLDSLSGIVYIDSARDETYRFVSWQRSYDRWQFFVMGFWNPEVRLTADTMGGRGTLPQDQQRTRTGQNPLIGRGVQLMAVFNH